MSGDQDLERTVAAARRAGPSWNPGRQQRLNWAVLGRLQTSRRRRPQLALAVLAAGAAGVALYAWRTSPGRPASVASAPRAAGGGAALSTELADGTRIQLDGPATVLRKSVEASDEVVFELDAGGARFEVARRPSRVFRVRAGDVTVQVIGTGFRVERRREQSRVAVEHGRVLVSWWGGSRELGAGEAGLFPPERSASAVSTTAPAPVLARAPSAAHARAEAAPPVSGPDRLFARADQARAEGKPQAAIAYLREIVDRFPADAHAPAAAFTTGRLLLESVRKPREAAAAFAEARALAGSGPLAEDALAREVEALHAAGDTAAARARAQLYATLFPTGVRLDMVRRYGGLSAAATADR